MDHWQQRNANVGKSYFAIDFNLDKEYWKAKQVAGEITQVELETVASRQGHQRLEGKIVFRKSKRGDVLHLPDRISAVLRRIGAPASKRLRGKQPLARTTGDDAMDLGTAPEDAEDIVCDPLPICASPLPIRSTRCWGLRLEKGLSVLFGELADAWTVRL